jgi:hypothetical protein
MSEIIFDGTDPDVTAAREATETKNLETGSKIIEAQEAANAEQYRRSQTDSEDAGQYAGKFKSAEDLEKAYLELQKKLGSKESESADEDSSEETTEEPTEETEPETESPVTEKVQLLKDASEEYYANGNALKPETLQKLKEMPSEQLIEAYMEFQKNNPVTTAQSLSDADAQSIVTSVGGQDAYNDTLAWAADNLKPEEVAAYDNVMNSGSKDAIFFAVQSLNNRYKDAVGFEGNRLSGNRAPRPEPGFRSQAELARAISDPRYRNDPAYRYDVEQKLANSNDLM